MLNLETRGFSTRDVAPFFHELGGQMYIHVRNILVLEYPIPFLRTEELHSITCLCKGGGPLEK
jgi:hypothetical protein